MALAFRSIAHSYDRTPALQDVSFSAQRGAITCLLGPSGCGKTTLLNLTAGILAVQHGEILLDDEVLARPGRCPPPEDRPVGLVFQDGALFPHMTVGDNVAFGLDGQNAELIERRLTQVGLSGFAERMPSQLSGGQQQRVALIRALAPEPSVMLLDEPFANIDNRLRRTLREDTRSILKSSNAVAIMVTHDPEEAIEIADELVIMEDGHILQAGAPAEIYSTPQSLTVASMFGNGQVIRAELTDSGVTTPFGLWPAECLKLGMNLSGAVDLVVRPEAMSLGPGQTPVTDHRSVGPYHRIILTAPDGSSLVCHADQNSDAAVLQQAGVMPHPRSIFAYPHIG